MLDPLARPAERAYAMAGLSPQDMGMAEIYNSFAIQETEPEMTA